MKPYDGDLISEEEFIYDGLNIEPLYQVLTNSLRNYNGESEDEDSENETTEIEEITKNISEKKEKNWGIHNRLLWIFFRLIQIA